MELFSRACSLAVWKILMVSVKILPSSPTRGTSATDMHGPLTATSAADVGERSLGFTGVLP